MTLRHRLFRPVPLVVAGLVVLAAGGVVVAQIESGDRGVAPIDSSGNYEINGVEVDVSGKTADAARLGGWREAQRRGWAMLYSRMNAGRKAPRIPDSTLDSIVTGIVVEEEEIGPNRYIARLGILFDRARAGQLLGVSGQVMRSPPMLVIPVQWTGSVPVSFEQRTEWQKAWARFRSGGSPIDYIRPSGTGSDPVLLNVAQSKRRGRGWWRMLLDQYGAADVIVPEVRLERFWPGGPIMAHFIARHGPDAQVIEEFSLRVASSEGLPRLMDEGVRRVDAAYIRALQDGRLAPDPSLVIEEPEELEIDEAALVDSLAEDVSMASAASFTVQVETPDVASISAVEGALRRVVGVRAAEVSSLALGGVSVFRVAFTGDLAAFRSSLVSAGWAMEEGNGNIRLRRAAPVATPAPASPPGGSPPAQ